MLVGVGTEEAGFDDGSLQYSWAEGKGELASLFISVAKGGTGVKSTLKTVDKQPATFGTRRFRLGLSSRSTAAHRPALFRCKGFARDAMKDSWNGDLAEGNSECE